MFFTKQQDQPHSAPHAPARALATHSSKLELNNPRARPRSLIDRSANLVGDVWSDGDIQIDGHLCGNINCEQFIIGKEGAVTGVIIAHEAVIRGKMTGLIRATRVLLQGSARVASEIVYRSLSVDEGASFEGLARPHANPLAEESALAPSDGARSCAAPAEVVLAPAQGSGLSGETLGRPGASLEPQRSIEHSAAQDR
jgi:cytoskeletal protein CcmA (bactofilin family)